VASVSCVRVACPCITSGLGVEWLRGVASGAQGCCKWLFVVRVILTTGVVVTVRTFVAPLRVEPALPVGPFRVVVVLLRPRL